MWLSLLVKIMDESSASLNVHDLHRFASLPCSKAASPTVLLMLGVHSNSTSYAWLSLHRQRHVDTIHLAF